MGAPEPIFTSVDLATTPARAHDTFTAKFGEWWPVETHSLSRHASTRCVLDPNVDGILEERAPDGTRHV